MNENKKPVYETPVIIELGELARGAGPPGGQNAPWQSLTLSTLRQGFTG